MFFSLWGIHVVCENVWLGVVHDSLSLQRVARIGDLNPWQARTSVGRVESSVVWGGGNVKVASTPETARK